MVLYKDSRAVMAVNLLHSRHNDSGMLISHNEGKVFAQLVSLMHILQHRSRNAVKADSMVLIQGVARRGRWGITCRDEQELGTASPASRASPQPHNVPHLPRMDFCCPQNIFKFGRHLSIASDNIGKFWI